MQKVVLAYSGGLDTSVCIKWLEEKYGYKVVALVVDLGQGGDWDFVRQKALGIGALRCHVVDARAEFARDFIAPALKANALYEGVYPISTALARPLIARLLVEVAQEEGAKVVAHGCTGKGNDQVRFDLSIAALDPDLEVIAPVREWAMSREEEIRYAQDHGIPIPVDVDNPFSIDQNLWGRSIECGVLEDPWAEPPPEAFAWTVDPTEAPAEPEYITVGFRSGVPVSLDGREMDLVELIDRLNRIGGAHGVGRIDHIENRLVGIKSREVYECPAATILISAHRQLEDLCLTREVLHFKPALEAKLAELTYYGLWHSPLREALSAFVDNTQGRVTGSVRLKLYKGSCHVVGRRSPYSLYDHALATYDEGDAFDHTAAEGFIKIWGLETVLQARAQRKGQQLGVAGE